MTVTRLISIADVPVLAELHRVNRDFLAPWEPLRTEEFYTERGQRGLVEGALVKYEQRSAIPHVILDDSGQVAGRISLNDIVRGPLQSCNVGYWVSAATNGRGLATRGVREITDLAFGELGLHRVEAGTLPHNVRSQHVLERNGFTRFGLAPAFLLIAGRWQDHVLYQLLAEDAARRPRG
jgi:ribosomal-protein-alanine N-acetyltransferase